MRIYLTFETINCKKIILPINYQHIVQGFLYKSMKPAYAEYLHKYGFSYEKRRFKLFTFSKIFGNYDIDIVKKQIIFNSPISLFISSPIDDLIRDYVKIIVNEKIELNGNILRVISVETKTLNNINNNIVIIKMLSPIVEYSTIKDSCNKTLYYTPFENKFFELIKNNLVKKYIAYYNKEPNDQKFSMLIYKVDKNKNCITTFFKGSNGYTTVIKGWTGLYKICGSEELIRFSYDTGLGSKNSAGFGMWDIWR